MLLKKDFKKDMFQRAMLPIQSGVTAFCSLALVLNLNLLGQVWQPVLTRMALGHISNLKKVRQMTITICSGLSHPPKIPQQILSQRAGTP
jgi:hypothetical protein